MTTRLTTEAFNDAPEKHAGLQVSTNVPTKRAGTPEMNLSTNDPLLPLATGVGKKGSREVEGFVLPTPLLTESYKPQKSKICLTNGASPCEIEALWQTIQPALQQAIPLSAYQTWIAPCQAIALGNNQLTLRVESEFNRELIQKRYRKTLEQALLAQTGQALTLRFQVDATAAIAKASRDEAQAVATTATPSTSPWAVHQNPTDDPEVAILLERYGDMRGVILNSKLFEKPCTPIEQGGWGISVGAMITAGKQHTLAQVIRAVRQTAAYRGANNRGGLFYHILRKGLEADRRPS